MFNIILPFLYPLLLVLMGYYSLKISTSASVERRRFFNKRKQFKRKHFKIKRAIVIYKTFLPLNNKFETRKKPG